MIETGTYTIDVVGVTDGFDSILYLYGVENAGNPTILENNDDGGDGLGSRIVRNLDDGQYEIRVEEFLGLAGECIVSVTLLE